MMVRMTMFAPSSAFFPKEDRPAQKEQSDKAYRAEDKQTFTRGRIRHAPGRHHCVSRFVGQ
jgi:hypothetical protein